MKIWVWYLVMTYNTDTDPEEPFVVVLYCSIKKAT